MAYLNKKGAKMTDTSDDVGQILRDSPTGQLSRKVFGEDEKKKVNSDEDRQRRRKQRDRSLVTGGFVPNQMNQGF